MRILYVNDALAIFGGLERVMVEKVNELVNRYNYDIYIVTLNQGDHKIPFPLNNKVVFSDLNVQYHRQYQFHVLRKLYIRYRLKKIAKKKLKDYINCIVPDIIVCWRSELLTTLVQVNNHIPIVFESHTSRFAQKFEKSSFYNRLKADYYNSYVKYVRKIISLTDGDANDWRRINSEICVIPNVVHLNDSGRFSDCQSCSVIFVGRFSAQKDVESLLKIWKNVHERFPEWILNVYGGYGEQHDKVLSEIDKMKANIVVHEPTSEMIECYVENSLLLLTSLYEPFGLVIPEAMSCGLPVVSFDCPYGPSSLISDGVNGYLIKNRNIDEFADKVCLLIKDLNMRVRMGKAGIVTSQRFSADNIMPKWKSLFESIIA